MRHTVQAEGFGVRLRPVRMEDSAFIVQMRNSEHARGRLGDSAADVAGQEAWLAKYFEREGDYYFIVETLGGIAVGTHSLYEVKDGSAELGRWIISPGVQAAVPSHMVAFDIAFNRLGLDFLRNATVSTNQPVISISRKFGFRQLRVDRAARVIGGKPVDMVQFTLTASDWVTVRERLVPTAEVAERLVREWEQQQLAGRGCSGCGTEARPS